MTSDIILATGFAAILALVHFFGEEIDERTYPHQAAVASIASGLTVAYIFLQLLPELHHGVDAVGPTVFLLSLTGFSAIHIAEKYIYHHDSDVDHLRHDFKELHSAFLFIYHLGLGIVIQYLLSRSLIQGTLFFVPVLFHTAVSSLSLTELHEDVLDSTPVKMLVSSSVILGVLLASTMTISSFQFYAIIAVIVGMFIYVVIRDSLSPQEAGEPLHYLLGATVYTAIILFTWSLV